MSDASTSTFGITKQITDDYRQILNAGSQWLT